MISEMHLIPGPGEVMLYVALHDVENMSAIEALKLCESLGFTPELRCRTWQEDGQQQYGIYAMLHYEQRDYDSALEYEYVTDRAFEELANRIVPDIAVHFTYRLKQGRMEMIAA